MNILFPLCSACANQLATTTPIADALHWAMLDFLITFGSLVIGITQITVIIRTLITATRTAREQKIIMRHLGLTDKDKNVRETTATGGTTMTEENREGRLPGLRARLVRSGDLFTEHELEDGTAVLDPVPMAEQPAEEPSEPWALASDDAAPPGEPEPPPDEEPSPGGEPPGEPDPPRSGWRGRRHGND